MDKTTVRIKVDHTLMTPKRHWWSVLQLRNVQTIFVKDFTNDPFSSERRPERGDQINVLAASPVRNGQLWMKVADIRHPGGEIVELIVSYDCSYLYRGQASPPAMQIEQQERYSEAERKLQEADYTMWPDDTV